MFAALEIKTGQVTGQCFRRRRAKEFLKVMKDIARQYAGRELHIVLDNLSTHSTEEIKRWLTKNPNITLHFTPIQLIRTIKRYIANWNTDCEPFV